MRIINKKGFTLVEIIITLAIVITITTVAVGSYIGISNQKKKEEWKLVKNQIETAAEQYFSSNKYKFEGLSTSSSIGVISVGTLVKEDYLNKVVDPYTKRQVDSCSVVEVNKTNDKYNGVYKEEEKFNSNGTCDSDYYVTSRDKGASNGDVKYYKEDNTLVHVDSTGWFNINSLGYNDDNSAKPVKVCVSSSDKDTVKAIIDGNEITTKTSEGYCYTINDDINKEVTYKLINAQNKIWQKTEVVKKDTIRPVATITVNGEETPLQPNAPRKSYKFSDKISVSIDATDNLSGVNDNYTVEDANTEIGYQIVEGKNPFPRILDSKSLSPGEDLKFSYTVFDNAGNPSDGVSNTFDLVDTPSCDNVSFSMNDAEEGDNGYYVSNVVVGVELNDTSTLESYRYFYSNDSTTGLSVPAEMWSAWQDPSINTPKDVTFYNGANGTNNVKVHIQNAYGLQNTCQMDNYKVDTENPSCPSYAYESYITNPGDKGGRCILSGDGNGYRCYKSKTYNGIDGSKMMVYVTNTAPDAVKMDWYTNIGDYNVADFANFEYRSTDTNLSTTFYHTIHGMNIWVDTSGTNKSKRMGMMKVTDVAGNVSYCPTKSIWLKAPDNISPPTTTSSSGGSSDKCYTNLTYHGTKGDNDWYKSNVTVKSGSKTLCTIKKEGTGLTCSYKVGKKTCKSAAVKIDKTAPTVKYNQQPKAKKCGGKKGVYVKYTVTDKVSGVKEIYHYLGSDGGAKAYNTIKNYDIKYTNFKAGASSVEVERTWAVGNPKKCGSPNQKGPNTYWCYKNNTAVKDQAGNSATGISSGCHKVGY